MTWGTRFRSLGSPEGVFYRDTRHLSHYRLTIAGARPMLLSATVREDNAMLICDLTNPDLTDAQGGTALDHDLIHVRRSQFLWNAAYRERLVLHNFDQSPRRVQIELAFAADFADLFEVRGAKRPRRGEIRPPEIGARRRQAQLLRPRPSPAHHIGPVRPCSRPPFAGRRGIRRRSRPRPIAFGVYRGQLQRRRTRVGAARVFHRPSRSQPRLARRFVARVLDVGRQREFQ